MKIRKKIISLILITSSLVVGCSTSTENNLAKNKTTENTSMKEEQQLNKEKKETTELQQIYFDIAKKIKIDDSKYNVNKIMDSYKISKKSNSDYEEIFYKNKEQIKVEYDKDKVESIIYFNNKYQYSETKEFFTLKYDKKGYSILFRKNDLNELKDMLKELDCDIVHFSLYDEYMDIADILNKNDNLTENDFKKLDFDLKTYDSDGFYKTADDCYITVETVTSKNLIFNLSMFYPKGDVAMQYLYSRKSSLVEIKLDRLKDQKNYIKILNMYF